MSVLVAGHCCVDITPQLDDGAPGMEPGILYPVGPLRFKVGGSAANTGGALLALGEDVEIVVTMGKDELGSICRNELARKGGKLRMFDSELPSSYSIVIEHGRHDRTFWQHEGSNAAFDPRNIDFSASDAELVHMGYPSLLPIVCQNPAAMADAFAAARQHNMTTSLDLAHVGDGSLAAQVDWQEWFKRTLPQVDILSPSWDDITSALAISLPPGKNALMERANQLIDWGAAVVSISAGSHGFVLCTASVERLRKAGSCLANQADQWANMNLWFPAHRIENPATTVGAGDTLTAGLLHAVLHHMSPQDAGAHAREIVGRHLRQVPLR